MYKCSVCGGWFTSAHYCVGQRETTAGSVWPRQKKVMVTCSRCGAEYDLNEAHYCQTGTIPHTEFPVTERPLKEMLQELIDLLKQRPLIISI